MNVPNLITLFRILLIPLFIVVFFSSLHYSFTLAIIIFFAAGASDVLDGHLARKYNLITKWGIVFDPLADKLMVLTVLTCLYIKNYIPIWILILLFLKEFFMIISGGFLFKKDTVIPSNIFGKLSTVLFYFSILMLIVDKAKGIYFLYIALACTFVALWNYMLIYKKSKH